MPANGDSAGFTLVVSFRANSPPRNKPLRPSESRHPVTKAPPCPNVTSAILRIIYSNYKLPSILNYETSNDNLQS